MILLRYFLLHLKSMKYNMYQVWYTANIINAIFTLFMGVPDSTVIPPYFLHLIIDIQWFTATSALLHCMANTCNLYAFLWVSEFPLHICIYLQCRYLPFSTQCILLLQTDTATKTWQCTILLNSLGVQCMQLQTDQNNILRGPQSFYMQKGRCTAFSSSLLFHCLYSFPYKFSCNLVRIFSGSNIDNKFN